MIDLRLPPAKYQDLVSLLLGAHQVKIQLLMLDLSHNYIGDISSSFLGGSVTIDTTTDVTRSMSLDLIDFNGTVGLDPGNPDVGSAFPTRMIQCIYRVGSPAGDRWYDIPLFTGPVNKVGRNGAYVKVECQGKESLALTGIWTAKTYNGHYQKQALVMDILRTMSGENKFDVTYSTKDTNLAPVIFNRGTNPIWPVCRALIGNTTGHLFYDGRGNCRIRPRTGASVWTFDERSVLDDPDVNYNQDKLENVAQITAMNKMVFKKQIDPNHPLSPQSLGRNGVARFYPHIEDNQEIGRPTTLENYGQRVLQDGVMQAVDVAASVVTNPLIEEDDMFTLSTSKFSVTTRLQKTTIPLLVTESQSLGYTKAVRPSALARSLGRAA